MFKNHIAKYRVWKGITQGELAKKIGVSLTTLRDFERGERLPKYQIRQRLAEFFDVSPIQLWD